MELTPTQVADYINNLQIDLQFEKARTDLLARALGELADLSDEEIRTLPLITVIERLADKLGQPMPKIVLDAIKNK